MPVNEAFVKTFTQKAKEYPDRFQVPADKRSWDVEFPEYNPEYPLFPELDNQPWRDPVMDLKDAPKNPYGRTGIAGRGILGHWGQNWAADPVITMQEPETGEFKILLIQRGDTGEWAIPGGMVDAGETRLSITAARELKEETGVSIDMDDATLIYEGYVDDPRNTDNAWMMTKAYHKHLDPETTRKVLASQMRAEDANEIKKIKWIGINDTRLNKLYASHTEFVKKAIDRLATN